MFSSGFLVKEEFKMATVIFDVDDTLYDQLVPFKQAYEKNFSFRNILIEELFSLSRRYSDQVFDKTTKGLLSLSDMQIYRIRNAFKHFGVAITDEQGRNFQIDYQMNQERIRLLPEMKDALNSCSKNGIQLGIITNGPADHQMKKIKALGLNKWIPDTNIFVSGKLGFSKPDLKMFQYAEKAMRLNRETTYYVGDSFVNDIIGAKKAGWKAVWVNRRNSTKTDCDIIPDYIVNNHETMNRFIDSLICIEKQSF